MTAAMPIVTVSSTIVNPRFEHGGFVTRSSLEIDKYPPHGQPAYSDESHLSAIGKLWDYLEGMRVW
jgi:hypothetical protein